MDTTLEGDFVVKEKDKELETKWYAVYTRPRFEKQVLKGLLDQGIDGYLPLIKTMRQWSDRKKMVEVPLFSSYVFVNVNRRFYDEVLKTHGVVKYITFERKAVSIPPLQIEAIKTFIESGDDLITNTPDMKIGDRVRVTRGSLQGLEGTLVEFHQKHRVRIMIDVIQQSLHIKVPVSQLHVIK